jgi:hypothetical protein
VLVARVAGFAAGAVAAGAVDAVPVWAGVALGLSDEAVPHVLTPPWPRQAPDRVAPENADPSLHVAVTADV